MTVPELAEGATALNNFILAFQSKNWEAVSIASRTLRGKIYSEHEAGECMCLLARADLIQTRAGLDSFIAGQKDAARIRGVGADYYWASCLF
jgi:hypothetical protein